jgi:regulation of enolase protein 1 (concanavalin A-like superfamily)
MSFDMNALPASPSWQVEPVTWEVDSNGMLSITAGSETDLFYDPGGKQRRTDAPRALFTPDRRFTLSAHVTVEFAATYDAGALLVWADEDHWGKLCFEYSPQAQPMVVSVVTNDYSDDCNSAVFARNDIYLRVSRLGNDFAFHCSEDGSYWHLVRHFTLHSGAALAGEGDLQIGFLSQSPTGGQCTATFSDITYHPEPVKQIRSGE